MENGACGPDHAGGVLDGVGRDGELVDVLRRQRDVHGSSLVTNLLPVKLTLALKSKQTKNCEKWSILDKKIIQKTKRSILDKNIRKGINYRT